jgi:hypothetical protein
MKPFIPCGGGGVADVWYRFALRWMPMLRWHRHGVFTAAFSSGSEEDGICSRHPWNTDCRSRLMCQCAPMVLEFSTRHRALARKRDEDAISIARSLEYERTPARRNQ